MAFENFHIGAGELTVGGVNVGHTTPDGIVITYEPDVHEHMSGKYGNTPVKATLIGQRLTLQITMGETTAENMSRAMAGAVLDGGSVQFGGVAGREIEPVELVMTPYDGTEPWTFHAAVPTGSVEMAYQVDNERVFQVTFVALVDESQADGEELATFS